MKFFYLQKIDDLYWLTLTDGKRNFPLVPEGYQNEDNAVTHLSVHGACLAVQKYNRIHSTNYMIKTHL